MPPELYKVLKNDVYGRHMVANRNIKQGELILKEKPILIGPQVNGSFICFNCCKILTHVGYIFCVNCKTAIICTPKCTGNFHNETECQQMKDLKISGEDFTNNPQIIFPLRCFLIEKQNPAKWAEVIELEPHLAFRRNTPIWRRHKINVEDVLMNLNIIEYEDVRLEVIQKICGILDVNTFEVRPPQSSTPYGIRNPDVECLRGLYLSAALMTHDCISNTHLSVDNEFVMTVYASVDIPEGELIYFNYANTLQGSIERKQHLREGKYFECKCKRCQDPTEFNSEISSLKCHKCLKGVIRAKAPEERHTDWECGLCKSTFSESLMKLTVAEGKRLIQEIDINDVGKMEKLLTKLQTTFHPNHYLVLDLIQNLIGLYIRSAPNKKNLARKIELCTTLVSVFEKIEPGISRLKGISMYELHSAEVDLAHKEYRSKEIDEETLLNRLTYTEDILKTATKYLLYEPVKSPEGEIAQKALSELKLLRKSILDIQKDILIRHTEVDVKPKVKVNRKVKTVEEKIVEKQHVEEKSLSEMVDFIENTQQNKQNKKSRNKNKSELKSNEENIVNNVEKNNESKKKRKNKKKK